MAETLQLSRNTKVYIRDYDSTMPATSSLTWWEVPVLDGFAFSQATESTQITLTEASDSTGRSRRGQLAFNTALAPVEWSLTTYVRPFKGAGGRTNTVGGFVENVAGFHHAVEEPLWAYLVMGKDEIFRANTGVGPTTPGNTWGWTSNGVYSSASSLNIDFARSNKTALRTFDLIFAMSSAASPDTVYTLNDACVNGVTLDFDIEGIAQLQWSGFARNITHSSNLTVLTSNSANSITEGINSTNSFIRNRLSTANISTFMREFGSNGTIPKFYNIILTGGSINIDNGITYLTPEELAKVNIPLGHVTGTRSITGTFTAYLDDDTAANSSGALFRNMVANTSASRNDFPITFSIGGATAPKVEFIIPDAHLEIPTHSVDDVISVEVNFTALPSVISNTDEMTIKYYGV